MPLTRRLILQKARHHTIKSALTDCKHMVSGTISLPSRGTFHHSLTVLNTLSVTLSISAYRVVPADSQQIPRARCYSGKDTTQPHTAFSYRTLTCSGRPSQASSPNCRSHAPGWQTQTHQSQQHRMRNHCHVSHTHGLATSTFARRY